jgi:hypothetical protein
MKQTAVEWLEEKFKNSHANFINWSLENFEQAKEIERQQIIDFAESYVFECVTCSYEGESISLKDTEQHYNETFNK